MKLDLANTLLGVVIGLVPGAMAGFAANVYLNRPNLKLLASGFNGGFGGQLPSTYVQVHNERRFFGIALGETRIFGKLLHGDVRRGRTYEVETSRHVSALLKDPETGAAIQLEIKKHGAAAPQGPVHLACTEQATISLFTLLSLEPLRFQVSRTNYPNAPRVFEGERKFVLDIRGEGGPPIRSLPVRIGWSGEQVMVQIAGSSIGIPLPPAQG